MPIQNINTGSSANAGNGDSIRLAFDKVNRNFSFVQSNLDSLSAGNFTSLRVTTTATLNNLTVTGTTYLNSVESASFYNNTYLENIIVSDKSTLNHVTATDVTVTGNAKIDTLDVLTSLSVGSYQIAAINDYDDFSIIKNDATGLAVVLLNTNADSNSKLVVKDNISGGLAILHQNVTNLAGDFVSGENYIYGETPTDVIHIGAYSDLKFTASQAKYYDPSLPETPSVVIQSIDGAVHVYSSATFHGAVYGITGAGAGYTGSQGTTGYTGSASTATGYTGSQGPIGTATTSTLVNGTSTVSLSTSGAVTLPIGVTIDEYYGTHFPRIVADTGKAFSVQGYGSTGSVALQWIETASTSSKISQVGLNKFGDGLAKVTLTAGATTADMKMWRFDSTGTLTLPAGGTIKEDGGLTGAIRLTPAGGANEYQALVIYPTAVGDGDHIHLTAGGGTTELYLGNDFHYVKLVEPDGNIEVRATHPDADTAAWTFDSAGNIDAQQALGIKVPNGVPSSVTNITMSTAYWELNPLSNLATTGGSGSGLTVTVTQADGYVNAIAIATAGTGYTAGDVITVTSGSSSAAFIIAVAGRNTWLFGTNSALRIPGVIMGQTDDTLIMAPLGDAARVLNYGGNQQLYVQDTGVYIQTSVNNSGTVFKTWQFGLDGKLTAPGNLQVDGGKIILNTGGNAYVESVDYGVNTATSALNIFGGPYQKIKLRAGFGTEATWTFGTAGSLTFPDATVQTTAYTGLTPNGTKASTDTGTAGQTSYDSQYFYVCVATNSWRRMALGSY